MMPEYHSWDVKFGGLTTHLPEIKVIWDLHALAGVPGLAWLSTGAVDLSYGYLFQSTPYGQLFTDKNAPPGIGKLLSPGSTGGRISCRRAILCRSDGPAGREPSSPAEVGRQLPEVRAAQLRGPGRALGHRQDRVRHRCS